MLLVALALLLLAGCLRDGAAIDVTQRFAAPSLAHPLGTDALGRDTLARLAAGGVVALGLAFLTTVLALGLGTLLGVLAARGPAALGGVVLILLDAIGAFPSLLLALAIVALLGPGAAMLVAVVGLGLLPQFARLARAETLALRHAEYLRAAEALGVAPARILWRHVLPAIAPALLVLACLTVPAVVAIEAGLGFLGLGVTPPAPSWGGLLFEGYSGLDQSPWPLLSVCVALILATLGFTLSGEAWRRRRNT